MRLAEIRIRQIIKEELSRAQARLSERDDEDDYTPAYSEMEDEGDYTPAYSEYVEQETADAKAMKTMKTAPKDIVDAYKAMSPKPANVVIIDCTEVDGSGPGYYPGYWADGATVKKFSDDVGEFIAHGLIAAIKEGTVPDAFYAAWRPGGVGPLEITDTYEQKPSRATEVFR